MLCKIPKAAAVSVRNLKALGVHEIIFHRARREYGRIEAIDPVLERRQANFIDVVFENGDHQLFGETGADEHGHYVLAAEVLVLDRAS